VALIVREEPRPIVLERRLHAFLEHFFGFKKMTVSVDNHDRTSFQICWNFASPRTHRRTPLDLHIRSNAIRAYLTVSAATPRRD
jgi:hypothetical protein